MSNQLSHKEIIEKTSEIVRWYRQEHGLKNRPLSFARFADELSQFGQKVSYQTIKNWEDGVHAPDGMFLVKVVCKAPRTVWQHTFASEVLAIYMSTTNPD